MTYQWLKGAQSISGATTASYTIQTAEYADSDYYSVVVGNPYGSITSASAFLSVAVPTSGTPAPQGIVAWWRAEGNANDAAGANHGTFTGSYNAGQVGQAFTIDSSHNVQIPASAALDLGAGNALTIEGWIKPYDTVYRPVVEWAPSGNYGLHIWASFPDPGCVWVNLFGTDGLHHSFQSAAGLLTVNTFQHLAVTYDKLSGNAQLFRNGAPIQTVPLGTFTPQTTPALYLGYRPSWVPNAPAYFSGLIDEISLYNRALSAPQIQAIVSAGPAGKYPTVSPPSITCP